MIPKTSTHINELLSWMKPTKKWGKSECLYCIKKWFIILPGNLIWFIILFNLNLKDLPLKWACFYRRQWSKFIKGILEQIWTLFHQFWGHAIWVLKLNICICICGRKIQILCQFIYYLFITLCNVGTLT